MKASISSLFLMVSLITGSFAFSQNTPQDPTSLPGDNFSLEGALELFKKATSPEDFERLLNEEENKVNNLDLNGDGEIDYIRVIDKSDDDAHAFVLQAVISDNENQDIAVIEMERNRDNATLQIIGDEDIYGEQRIVEPLEEVKSHAGTQVKTVVVNVYSWPVVQYVYSPAYRFWASPWGWGVRPPWWRPWRPVAFHVFYRYHDPYRHRYVIVHTHRTKHAHRIYRPVRSTSVIVKKRYDETVNHDRDRAARTPTVTKQNERIPRKSTTGKAKKEEKQQAAKRPARTRN